MSRIRENLDTKKGAILVALGTIASVGLGFVIYRNKDNIKNYVTSILKKDEEEIVNDVDNIINTDLNSLTTSNSSTENNTDVVKSTPVPLQKGTTILDQLVQQNEKSRIEHSDNSED